jgi:hypothetical protein
MMIVMRIMIVIRITMGTEVIIGVESEDCDKDDEFDINDLFGGRCRR